MQKLTLLALAFIFSGFLASATRADEVAPKRITIHLPNEPATLDWNLSTRLLDQYLIFNLQEGLVEIGANRRPRPLLAQGWTVSTDGKIYTFYLRQGVLWSDGKPLVAQHFIDSWKRLISPLTATGNGYFLQDVEGAEDFAKGRNTDFSKVGMKAVNDSTIRITLRNPRWDWIVNFALLASFPIREDLIAKHGAKYWTAPGNLVTVGPFVLESHDLDSGYVLRQNPKYWGPRGNLGELDFKIGTDSRAIEAFQNGNMDLICYLSNVEQTPASLHSNLRWLLGRNTKRLDFNMKRFPLGSTEVRHAIAISIDRKKIAQVLGAGIQPATSAAPPILTSYSAKLPSVYDPVLGRKLLKSANVDHLELEILVPMFDENAEKSLKAAEMIGEMLEKNLYAQVKIQKAVSEQQYSLIRDTGEYTLLLRDWVSSYDADEFYSFYATQSRKSMTWSNARYDGLVEQTRAEKLPEKREDDYRQLDLLLNQEFAVWPIFYQSSAALVGARITKFDVNLPHSCQVRDLNLR